MSDTMSDKPTLLPFKKDMQENVKGLGRIALGLVVILFCIGAIVEAASWIGPKIAYVFGVSPNPDVRTEQLYFLSENHGAVDAMILKCRSTAQLPESSRLDNKYLTADKSVDNYVPKVVDLDGSTTTFQRRIINVNNFLDKFGVNLVNGVERQQHQFNLMQFILISLGCVSTIFVGMKSVLSGSGWFSQLIGILAICASAGGTALTTLNTSSHLADLQSQTKQDLQQLTTLQAKLRFFVSRLDYLCYPGEMSVPNSDKDYLQTLEASAVDLLSGSTTVAALQSSADSELRQREDAANAKKTATKETNLNQTSKSNKPAALH